MAEQSHQYNGVGRPQRSNEVRHMNKADGEKGDYTDRDRQQKMSGGRGTRQRLAGCGRWPAACRDAENVRELSHSVAAAIKRGLTKRSKRPAYGCSADQSSNGKSMTTSPEVGRFSLSRARASTSPEAINCSARSCMPGL